MVRRSGFTSDETNKILKGLAAHFNVEETDVFSFARNIPFNVPLALYKEVAQSCNISKSGDQISRYCRYMATQMDVAELKCFDYDPFKMHLIDTYGVNPRSTRKKETECDVLTTAPVRFQPPRESKNKPSASEHPMNHHGTCAPKSKATNRNFKQVKGGNRNNAVSDGPPNCGSSKHQSMDNHTDNSGLELLLSAMTLQSNEQVDTQENAQENTSDEVISTRADMIQRGPSADSLGCVSSGLSISQASLTMNAFSSPTSKNMKIAERNASANKSALKAYEEANHRSNSHASSSNASPNEQRKIITFNEEVSSSAEATHSGKVISPQRREALYTNAEDETQAYAARKEEYRIAGFRGLTWEGLTQQSDFQGADSDRLNAGSIDVMEIEHTLKQSAREMSSQPDSQRLLLAVMDAVKCCRVSTVALVNRNGFDHESMTRGQQLYLNLFDQTIRRVQAFVLHSLSSGTYQYHVSIGLYDIMKSWAVDPVSDDVITSENIVLAAIRKHFNVKSDSFLNIAYDAPEPEIPDFDITDDSLYSTLSPVTDFSGSRHGIKSSVIELRGYSSDPAIQRLVELCGDLETDEDELVLLQIAIVGKLGATFDNLADRGLGYSGWRPGHLCVEQKQYLLEFKKVAQQVAEALLSLHCGEQYLLRQVKAQLLKLLLNFGPMKCTWKVYCKTYWDVISPKEHLKLVRDAEREADSAVIEDAGGFGSGDPDLVGDSETMGGSDVTRASVTKDDQTDDVVTGTDEQQQHQRHQQQCDSFDEISAVVTATASGGSVPPVDGSQDDNGAYVSVVEEEHDKNEKQGEDGKEAEEAIEDDEHYAFLRQDAAELIQKMEDQIALVDDTEEGENAHQRWLRLLHALLGTVEDLIDHENENPQYRHSVSVEVLTKIGDSVPECFSGKYKAIFTSHPLRESLLRHISSTEDVTGSTTESEE